MNRTRQPAATPQVNPRSLVLARAAAVIFAALNLRTAVTSVGPLLPEIQHGVGLSHADSGLLTAMPVLAFAVIGWLTPRMARRMSPERLLALALAIMSGGLVLRVLVSAAVPFLLLTVPTLAAGAMGNVLLPSLVKRDFAGRIGPATAAYTTALAVGTTLAAAAAVPLASVGPGRDWRLGLSGWAVPAALAAGLWATLPHRNTANASQPMRIVQVERLAGSRTAWALALFFGSQAMQAYIAFGWFAQFYRERAAASPADAGLLVAALAALSIPVSLLMPSLAARVPSQRTLIAGCVACYATAYAGMLLAPARGSWLWVALAGLGGGAFPLALTLIGLRSRDSETTGALSAFAQGVGYLIAGTGPLLVGVLRGLTGGWGAPFGLMFADLILMAAAGWSIGRPRFVDDDLMPGRARL